MIGRLVLLLTVVMSLPACVVLQSTHKEALVKIVNLEGEKEALSGKVRELEASINKKDKELQSLTEGMKGLEREKQDIESRAKAIGQELDAKGKEIVSLKKDVEDIRTQKDKEIEEIKLKIKEIQTRVEALLEKVKDVQK